MPLSGYRPRRESESELESETPAARGGIAIAVLAALLAIATSNPARAAGQGDGDDEGAAKPKPAAVAAARPGKAPIDRGIGQPISTAFQLTDIRGREVNLRQFLGRKALVVVFTGVDCPIGNLYMPTLVAMAKDYADKPVQFILVNSNKSETLEDVRKHAAEYGLDKVGPNLVVTRDRDNQLADLALAERTNEALIVDGTLNFQRIGRIRYRGAIDDQYHYQARKAEPTRNYLRDAIDDFLADREIRVPATEVEGCLIERGAPKLMMAAEPNGPLVRSAPREIREYLDARDAAANVEVGSVNYAEHVAPILQAKCQECHRPEQVAPFSLTTYDDARRWSDMIAEVVRERRMPPWHADPRHGEFANDRSLTTLERATLMAWAEQGAPLGDPTRVPPAREFPRGWTIGEPDMIIRMPRAHVVPAGGVVDYVRYFVEEEFPEDRWVSAIEARPGDRAVVHHIIMYYIPGGERIPRFLVGYAPGDLSSRYPEGVAKRIPKGSRFFFEMHYTPIGQIREDRSEVGLVFAKGPIHREAITRPIESREFERRRIAIPPGADNFPITSAMVFNTEVQLLGMMPHMHVRGKAFEYKVTRPGEERETILSVPAYDFAWQSYYWLKEPMTLPPGTRIDCKAWYDNSAKNLNNPDPTASVTWGDQTYEEMMIGFIDYTVPVEAGSDILGHGVPVTPEGVTPDEGEGANANANAAPRRGGAGGGGLGGLLRGIVGGGNANSNSNSNSNSNPNNNPNPPASAPTDGGESPN